MWQHDTFMNIKIEFRDSSQNNSKFNVNAIKIPLFYRILKIDSKTYTEVQAPISVYEGEEKKMGDLPYHISKFDIKYNSNWENLILLPNRIAIHGLDSM